MTNKLWKHIQAGLCSTALLVSAFAISPVVFAEETEPTETPAEVAETVEPTEEVTEVPTEEATEVPSEEPTEVPSVEPTAEPTVEPTEAPSAEPTESAEASEEPEASATPEESVEPSASASPSASAEASKITFVLPEDEAAYQWSALEENQEIDLIDALEITATDSKGNEVEVTVKDDGGLDLSVPGEYTITIAAINPDTELEETTTFVLTINGEELAMPLAAGPVYEVAPTDTMATILTALHDNPGAYDTIHWAAGTYNYTDALNIPSSYLGPNGLTLQNDGTITSVTGAPCIEVRSTANINITGGTWNLTGQRGFNLYAPGNVTFSNANLNINSVGYSVAIGDGAVIGGTINFNNTNVTATVTSSSNEGNMILNTPIASSFVGGTYNLDSTNSSMFGPLYSTGNLDISGSNMTFKSGPGVYGMVSAGGGSTNIHDGANITAIGNSGSHGINTTGPIAITGSTVNISGYAEDALSMRGTATITDSTFISTGNGSVFNGRVAGAVAKIDGQSTVVGAAPALIGTAELIIDGGNVDLPAATVAHNSNNDRLTRFDIPRSTTGAALNLGYTYECPSAASNAIWALAVNVYFYDQKYATYGTTGLLATVPVIKNTSATFSNRVSQVPTAPAGFSWVYEPSAAAWTTSVNAPSDMYVYAGVPTPTPTPTPVTPTPTPTPGPRTCQDDGYPAGYYWNGTACVAGFVAPNAGTNTGFRAPSTDTGLE